METDFTNGRRTIRQIVNKIFLFRPPGISSRPHCSPAHWGSAESRRLSFCRLPGRVRVHERAHMCGSQQRVRPPPSNRPPTLKETATAVSSAVHHQLILAGAATGGRRRRPAQVSRCTVADRCSAEIEREGATCDRSVLEPLGPKKPPASLRRLERII